MKSSRSFDSGRLVVVAASMAVLFGCNTEPADLSEVQPWFDQSEHEISFVSVAPGVDLEVADWGGTGPAMVFLPGLGNTSHAFDDFAPRFLDGFRVFSITRRGFGASSHPESGYDRQTLASDVIKVLDSKGIDKAILLGHSIASVELTELGSSNPDRVSKLIYLDTFCNIPEALPLLTSLFSAPPEGMAIPIGPTAPDTSTVEGYVSYVHQSRGVNIPESDIRARYESDGWDETKGLAYWPILEMAMSGSFLCSEVQVPSLTLISQRESIDQEEPWISRNTSSWAAQLEFQQKYREIVELVVDRFPKEIAESKAVAIKGGHHWVFTSHADEVERHIRGFLQ